MVRSELVRLRRDAPAASALESKQQRDAFRPAASGKGSPSPGASPRADHRKNTPFTTIPVG